MPRKTITEHEDEFSKTIVSFDLFFKHEDYQGGYSFPCDEKGNICFEELTGPSLKNAKKCAAGEMPEHEKGIVREWRNEITFCPCGSKKPPYDLNDARGIYVSKVCPACEKATKGKYRPEIFIDSNYETDEAVEAE